jgi:carbamate kinase
VASVYAVEQVIRFGDREWRRRVEAPTLEEAVRMFHLSEPRVVNPGKAGQEVVGERAKCRSVGAVIDPPLVVRGD